MKLIHHKGLSLKKWHRLSIFEQMANIGSEVERTIIWKNKDRLKEILSVKRIDFWMLHFIELAILEDGSNLNFGFKDLNLCIDPSSL